MKKLVSAISIAAISLGFTSCCSMFSGGGFSDSGLFSCSANYRTETKRVKTCGYDIVTEEVVTPGDAKSGKGGMVTTVEKKVPRYKTVTKKVRVSDGPCVRRYCPKKTACGTTSESTMRMATAQGGVGSPHIGLIPTMRPLPLSTKVTAKP